MRLVLVRWIATVLLMSLATTGWAYEEQILAVSVNLAGKIAASGRKSVAVVDFTDLQMNVTELGRFLAEEFQNALTGGGPKFRVVDRTHLRAILQEQKLGTTGAIDPQTARKLGQIAGVELLVTGSLTPFGDSVRLSVKVLDTTTADVVASATADLPRTKAVDELLARSVGSGSVAPAPQAAAAPRPVPGVQRVNAGGLGFELQACRGGGPITCEMFVLATDDVDLQWGYTGAFSGGRAFDANGNEFRLQRLMVGNRETRGRLVSNVRTRLTATFADENRGASTQNVTMLSLAELVLQTRDSFLVQFRNVPVAP